jgi:hypothetical protein
MSAKGLATGLLSGFKSGHAKCNMQSGYNSGLSNGIANNNKIQDPNLLRGAKLPWIYANADNTVDTGNFTAVMDRMKLPELWNAYTGLTIANHPDWKPGAGGIDGTFSRTGDTYVTDTVNDYVAFGTSVSGLNRAYPKIGGADLGDHVYLDLGGSSGTATGHWFGPANGIGVAEDSLLNNIAPTALTIMMVMKSKNTAGKTHFYIEDNITPGGINFTQPTADKLRLQLYSQSGVSSIYESCDLKQELNDWILVTIKCTLKQINGPGSEQEFYVNGKKQHQFVSSNWTTPEATQAWTAGSQGLTLGGAGTSTPVANGMYFASFLLLPYWANESEQLRLENYFRKYYGKKF